ncbi:TetR/AcrR family transcriptional regulator [Luteolibacter arcticus]|uniref:TetR/AcrR family transcriptional regulator n=1 Tax=Luteolibacter arcticus TaxID=1581411 RepID=A0ABT3GEP3_9BACT|nr:TetR/AcrR family transcriptional regulator [Luteolibacter arcticus]MCW1922076.1 TetR/AcrR family transcriptional regulator [Luteolibacter arcticus]
MSLSESKERMLAAAKALMLAQGYGGTTVDAICEKAGLTKGSFYHFFKSKEDLGLAVLEWSLTKGGKLLSEGPHAAIADPVARAFGFLDHVEACGAELWSEGCLLGTYASELASTNDRVQATVARMFREVGAYFSSELAPLVGAAPKGSLPDAEALGEQFLALLEGAIILGKAYRDPARIRVAVQGFRENMQRALALPV